jgi:NADH-quinone oxidoreductase subunit H
MISYEVALGLSIVAVFMTAGTMSTSGIVAAQAGNDPVSSWSILGWHPTAPSWYAVLLLPSFIIFFIASVGETNRAPFDLPEAESELVAGFMTEYSSLKFLIIMLTEYVSMISMSAITVTLFLGGWRAPAPITTFWAGANSGWWPMLWFMGKVILLIFVFIWLRATLPRFRYDQFMRLGWKVLLPINLVWILGLAGIRSIDGWETRDRWIALGIATVVVLLVVTLWPSREPAPQKTLQEQMDARPYGSFPLPPMDLQVPPSPRIRRTLAEREPANIGAGTPGSAGAGPDSDDKEV